MTVRNIANPSINQSSDFSISREDPEQSILGNVSKFVSGEKIQAQKFSSDFFLLPLLFAGCDETPVMSTQETSQPTPALTNMPGIVADLVPPEIAAFSAFYTEVECIYDSQRKYTVTTNHTLTFRIKANSGEIVEANIELRKGDIVRFSSNGDITIEPVYIRYKYYAMNNRELVFQNETYDETLNSINLMSKDADGAYSIYFIKWLAVDGHIWPKHLAGRYTEPANCFYGKCNESL